VRAQKTFIPAASSIRPNVMPIIFAQSLIIVPGGRSPPSAAIRPLKHLAEYFSVHVAGVPDHERRLLIIFFA